MATDDKSGAKAIFSLLDSSLNSASLAVSDDDLKEAMNRHVAQMLKPVSGGLGLFYVAVALSAHFFQTSPEIYPGISASSISAAVLFSLWGIMQRWKVPGRWAHPIGFSIAGLVILNSPFQFEHFLDPLQTIVLILLVISASCVFLAIDWLLLVIACAFCSWGYLNWEASHSHAIVSSMHANLNSAAREVLTSNYLDDWKKLGIALLFASAISLALQRVRIRHARHLISQGIVDSNHRDVFSVAMEAAKRKEERYVRISEASFEGLAILENGRIVDANQTLAKLFGRSLEETTGQIFLDLLAPESRPFVSNSLVLGDYKPFEAVGIRSNWSRFNIEIFTRGIDYQNRPLLALAVRDITKSKQSEEKLIEEQQRLAKQFERQTVLAEFKPAFDKPQEVYAALTYLTEAITRLLPARSGACLVLWDGQADAMHITNSTVAEFPSNSLLPLQHPLAQTIRYIWQSQEPFTVSTPAEDPFGLVKSPSGQIESFLAIPLAVGDEVLGALFAFEPQPRPYQTDDLSFLQALASRTASTLDKVRLYEKLYKANQMLEQQHLELQLSNQELAKAKESVESANRVLTSQKLELEGKNIALAKAQAAAMASYQAKSEFLATISHELRTPMNGILGMNQALLSTNLSPEQHEFAQTVNSSAEGLLSMINDLLDFAEIESARLRLEHKQFDLREIIDHQLDKFASRILNKPLELAAYVNEDVPARLLGDPSRVGQVLGNLLDNALKFTERGAITSMVRVEHQTPGMVLLRFEVSDTGLGIATEMQPKLFQAFNQAEGAHARKYGGMGLGLALSKQLIEIMGGDIGFTSTPGKGTTFWFTIRFETASTSEEARTRNELIGRLAGMRVLVADHHPAGWEYLQRQFQGWKMRCDRVTEGRQVVERIAQEADTNAPYAAVFLDAQLPGTDALVIARSLRINPSTFGTRLFWVGPVNQKPSDEVIKKYAFAGILFKPIRQSALLENLARLVESK